MADYSAFTGQILGSMVSSMADSFNPMNRVLTDSIGTQVTLQQAAGIGSIFESISKIEERATAAGRPQSEGEKATIAQLQVLQAKLTTR